MTEFRGFRCDGCTAIIENPKDRVKERTRFEGESLSEDYFRDLCRGCSGKARSDAESSKRPVPRRRRRLISAA